MTCTAIIAAMPAELKPLTRGWQHSRRNGVDLWRWSFADGEWIAACAGAGIQAATRAFAEVEKTGEVDKVISTGWAGALREDLVPGRALDISAVIDARTGERFLTSCFALGTETFEKRASGAKARLDCAAFAARLKSCPDTSEDSQGAFPQLTKPRISSSSASCTAEAMPFQNENRLVTGDSDGSAFGTAEAMPFQSGVWLVTSPKVADAHEKLRLAETYSAALVDMEASAIARLAQMRGLPFYCIKGISDGYTDKLPDFNRFISPDGRFQTFRFVLFAIASPSHWPALIRMGENSRKAARAIADSLLDLLDKDGQIRKRNGYPNHQR